MPVLKPSSTHHILRSSPWKLDRREERQPSNSACFVQWWTTALPLPDLSVIAGGSVTAVSSQDNSGVQGHELLLLKHNAMPYVAKRKQQFMDGLWFASWSSAGACVAMYTRTVLDHMQLEHFGSRSAVLTLMEVPNTLLSCKLDFPVILEFYCSVLKSFSHSHRFMYEVNYFNGRAELGDYK